jgi:hypothetical protein
MLCMTLWTQGLELTRQETLYFGVRLWKMWVLDLDESSDQFPVLTISQRNAVKLIQESLDRPLETGNGKENGERLEHATSKWLQHGFNCPEIFLRYRVCHILQTGGKLLVAPCNSWFR